MSQDITLKYLKIKHEFLKMDEPVISFINIVNVVKKFENVSIDSAVADVKLEHYELCREVMDRIGMWPSSDPILYALQKRW